MKKLFLSIFLFLMWCNISNIANAKTYGEGELKLSRSAVEYFIEYIRGKNNKVPQNFYITLDGYYSTYWYCQTGNCTVNVNKQLSECKKSAGRICKLFAKGRYVKWKNGINPGKGKASKFSSKMTDAQIYAKLTELGFYNNKKKIIETKEQKAAKEKKITQEKIKNETDSSLEKELEKAKAELEKTKKELEDLKKQKNTKKEEVKKEEVKKEEVKKEEQTKDWQNKEVVVIWKWAQSWNNYIGFEIKKQNRIIESNLPNCSYITGKNGKGNFSPSNEWTNCYGIKLMDQGDDDIFGNDPVYKYEGEWKNEKWHGKGKFTTDDGGIMEGIWDKNNLVKSEKFPELVVKNTSQVETNNNETSKVQDCSKVDAASTCNKNTDLTETVSFLVNGDLADKNDLNYRHWNINSCVLTRSPPNVLSNMKDTVDNFNKVIMKSMKFYKENNYSYAEADCSGECTRSPTGPDSKFIYQSNVVPERLEKAFIYFSSNFCKGFESKF